MPSGDELRATRPHLMVGGRVRVSEPGIRPWSGTLRSLKASTLSGWWAEVLRDEDELVYVVGSGLVTAEGSTT